MRAVPNVAAAAYAPTKSGKSMSLSQVQYPNHFGATTTSADVQEQFEPTYVKLDKQVSDLVAGRYATNSCTHRLTQLIYLL